MLERDAEGRVQYSCPRCQVGTVTIYENGSACDNCPWNVEVVG